MARIESFLSTRLFLYPRQVGGRLYFRAISAAVSACTRRTKEGAYPNRFCPPTSPCKSEVDRGRTVRRFSGTRQNPGDDRQRRRRELSADAHTRGGRISGTGLRRCFRRMARRDAEERFGTKHRLPERRIRSEPSTWPGEVGWIRGPWKPGRKQVGCPDCRGECRLHQSHPARELYVGRPRPPSVEGRGRAFPALRKTAGGARRRGRDSAERHPCLPLHGGGPGAALPHRPA